MTSIFTKIDPAHMADTSFLVQVFNISPIATEKKIYDFFFFCGNIIEYEIVKVEDGFEALFLFDKATSVDTALMLNNVALEDRCVQVKKYDEVVNESIKKALDEEDNKEIENQKKAEPNKLANILAESIVQTEQLGKNIDNKFRVTEKFQALIDEAVKIGHNVDSKLGITEKTNKATAVVESKIDELHINEKWTAAKNAATPRVAAAKSAAQPTVDTIINSTPVKKFQEIISQVKGKVTEVSTETRKLKEEKLKAMTSENVPAVAESETAPVSTPEPVTEANTTLADETKESTPATVQN